VSRYETSGDPTTLETQREIGNSRIPPSGLHGHLGHGAGLGERYELLRYIIFFVPTVLKNHDFPKFLKFPYRIGLADARHDDGGGVGAGVSGVVLSKGQVPAGVCVDRQESWQQFLKSSMYNYYIM
jgi:hypothetical protein